MGQKHFGLPPIKSALNCFEYEYLFDATYRCDHIFREIYEKRLG